MSLEVIGRRDGLPAAKLYATGRGAETREIDSVEEICAYLRTAANAVMFSLGETATVLDLSRIVAAAHAAEVQCGFLDGTRGAAGAEEHGEALLAWESSARPGVVTWLDSRYSALGALCGSYPGLRMLAVAEENIEALASAGQRVLGLATHGNGIDAQLADSVLCGLLDRTAGHELRSYYPCGYDGPCKRIVKHGDGTFTLPQRFSAGTLPGEVVIWGTCNGVLSADSPFDAHGGMVRALLRPSRPRQVITTYKPWQIEEASFLAACRLADAGVPLGEVVAVLNRAYLAREDTRDDPPWLLLGDPTATLPSGNAAVEESPAAIGRSRFGVARNANGAEDPLVRVTGAAESPRLWAAPVPGSPYVVWVHDGDDSAGLEATAAPAAEDHDYRTLGRVWSSGKRLAFTDEFFRDIAAMAGENDGYYPETVVREVAQTLQRMRSLEGVVLSGSTFSGWSDDLTALADGERSAWTALHLKLQQVFTRYVTEWGRTVHISQGNLSGAVPGPGAGTTYCVYCGSRAAVDRLRMLSGASGRSVIRCDRCMVVSDADVQAAGIWLEGPELVVPGRPAEYRIRLHEWPAAGVETMTGTLVLPRVPDRGDEPAATALAQGCDGSHELRITWTPAPDLDPGVYDVYGLAVIDGAVALAKRQLVVGRANAGESRG